MHAVVKLACGVLLCACFDAHDAPSDPSPGERPNQAADEPAKSDNPEVPITPDGFDWHAVYFVRRTVEKPRCGVFQIAALRTPEAVRLTLDCWTDVGAITLSPRGGTYYLTYPGPVLHAATCDEGCDELTATRSVIVATPPCDPEQHNPLEQVLIGPDGDAIHACADGRWYDEQGDLVYTAEHLPWLGPWHLGRNRLVFAGNYLIDLDKGEETEIRGLAPDAAQFRVVRSVRDGFWVVTWSAFEDEPPVLWEIDRAGNAKRKGEYPALSDGETYAHGDAALDSDGALYSVLRQNGSSSPGTSIVRRTIREAVRVVLDANGPIGPRLEALVTGP